MVVNSTTGCSNEGTQELHARGTNTTRARVRQHARVFNKYGEGVELSSCLRCEDNCTSLQRVKLE